VNHGTRKSLAILGAHVSVLGGVENAPERGRKLTCECMQIFSKNQMQWKAKPLMLENCDMFKENSQKFKIVETVIHDSYLINLASPDPALLKKSRESFLEEMVRARHLGVEKLIFHPGSHMGSGEQVGLKRIAESLDWCRKEFGGAGVTQVLEMTAGAGSHLGGTLEQIAKIVDLVEDPKSIGVCLDTCHCYASGYDIKTKKGYEQTLDAFDDLLGMGRLKAMHLNDSKGKLGSNLDRHEQIGKGYIGLDGFRNILNDPRLENVPMVLETPAGDKMYKKELKLLRSLIKK